MISLISPILAHCAGLLALVLLASAPTPWDPPARPFQDQAPSADEVINRHVEAIGGQAAIDAIQTMKYERIYVHIEEERIYHRLVHKKRPGMSSNCSLDTGRCVVVDGTRSWSSTVDPEDGSIEWLELSSLNSQSTNFEVRFGPFISYREKGITVEFVATVTIDDVPMHHLTMEMPGGERWDIYFDVETGLWSRFVTPAGGTVTIHDYRPTGDILFPRLTEVKGTRRDGTPAHHFNTIVSVELNVPIEDSMFRPGSSDQ